jgi:hypothetical protein
VRARAEALPRIACLRAVLRCAAFALLANSLVPLAALPDGFAGDLRALRVFSRPAPVLTAAP